MQRRAAIVIAAALASVPAAVFGDDLATYAELSRTGDLICQLRPSGNATNAQTQRGGVMLVIDEIGLKNDRARMVSSHAIGGKPVKVYSGETGVHLVEDVGASVRVTTLMGCDQRARGGRCLRFTAVQAWHFDRGVHQDADATFRKLPGTSYSGTCEAWRMESIHSVGR